MLSNENVRVGAVGAGQWATRHHLPAVVDNPRATLVGVCDSDDVRAQAAAARFDVPVYSLEELLRPELTDVVVISTPSGSHAALVRAALHAGVHVLVEKPFTVDPADAVELDQLATERGLTLMVGHTYQFSKAAGVLKGVLDRGELGDLVLITGIFTSMVEAYYRGRPEEYDDVTGFGSDIRPAAGTYSDPQTSGGGQAQAQLSHDAALISWLTNDSWDDVTAHTRTRGLPVDLVDAVAFSMTSGCIGTVASTGSLGVGDHQVHELTFVGTTGSARIVLDAGGLVVHRRGIPELDLRAGSYDPYPTRAPMDTMIALVGGTTTTNPSPAASSARAVAFIDAVYRSAEGTRSPTLDSPQRP